MLCEELEGLWHEKIPLSQAMALGIDSFDQNILISKAGLAPNVNVHGTAFAGSLYSVQALTGWGMIWLQLKLAGLEASVVIASANIEYMKPLTDDLITRCDFNTVEGSLAELEHHSKTRLQLTCSVNGKAGVVSQFVGDYAIRLNG
jgi:thioesterase domain-containing protein